ncbi:non-ribosomal peptide synthetase [Methylobacter sp. YRD-M1]|uniref:non-ribosomal peptide synthetase n=1 Tax=Methylobacter sp. YRD-M1 TaxID=2911520 RepID=UPI00227CC5BE|nr:amino acid adenylation domain-containing protein [Methylobacter sp. YRD-M1]WAK02505.1 amino acid adenylation domain-containing protein [Methylobacter sp. YRD-M1]
MNVLEVLAYLQERDIVVSANDAELIVQAPQGAINEEIMALLQQYKWELLLLLQDNQDDQSASETDAQTEKPAIITPDMLTLVSLTQDEIDLIVGSVPQGAANIKDIYPLAPLQQGMLFHHLLETQGDTYLTRSVILFDDRLGLDDFLDALQTVVDRHDILRTSVRWAGLPKPVQVVYNQAPLPVTELTLTADADIQQQLLSHTDPRRLRLDLQRAPLLAAYVAADPHSAAWWLVMLNHRMTCNNCTLQLIMAEVRLLLRGQGDSLPEPAPYRNFIAQLQTTSLVGHEIFFRQQLGDIDEPTAPFGLLDTKADSGQISEAVLALSDDLARRIRDSARQHGVSAAALFHAAWAQVLARCSGRDDVVFGTVLSDRLQGSAGADRGIGMFINTLPVRVPLAGASVRQLVKYTHQCLNELLLHKQAPLSLALRCSALPPSVPLFTALFNYRRHAIIAAARDKSALPGWDGMRVISSVERTHYPFAVSVDDWGQGFTVTAQCAHGIGPARINDYFHTAIAGLVEALAQTPWRLAVDFDILPAAERRQLLVDFNATAAIYPRHKCLHQLFEEQVEKTPDAVAVAFEEQALSYAELNVRANQLAHYLRSRNVGPETPIGLCVAPGPEMMVGLLGILKAGGAYVLIDSQYPEECAYMLDDACIALLLTQARLAAALPNYTQAIVYLDSGWPAVAQYPADNPSPCNHPLDLAYIIYTSGSTGKSKGVMVSHRNAVHSTTARFAAYQEPVRAYLLLSLFDSAVAGIFWTLGQGGCLCLPGEYSGKDPAALAALIERHKISHLLALPSFYALLLNQARAQLHSLKTAIVAGEICSTEVVRRHYAVLPHVALYNEYGPTEGSVWSSVHLADPDDLDRPLPIGRPINNVWLYILDKIGQPVPLGAAGELHIGGEGVVRGYLNHPELTAEKFVPDPFRSDGGRLYKTGDLARYRPDGCIEFLGRIDNEAQIHGFRIELGEIEAKLIAQPDVDEAVVLVCEDQPGNRRLIAYVTARGNEALTEDLLRKAIGESLPHYMQPSAYVFLESLPLNANGKIDRKALLPPENYITAMDKHDDSLSDSIELALAAIWMEILDTKVVGGNQSFFELGGHSMLAIQVISRIQEQFGIKLAIDDIFHKTTIRELAELIVQMQIEQLTVTDISALLGDMQQLVSESDNEGFDCVDYTGQSEQLTEADASALLAEIERLTHEEVGLMLKL